MKNRFIADVRKVIAESGEKLERDISITDMGKYFMVIPILTKEKEENKNYKEMSNSEIRTISYLNCPLKCTGCEALCDEMPVGQCRKNLSEKFDK